MPRWIRLIPRRRGQSAAEYGLIAAILGIGSIALLTFIGGNLRTYMNAVVQFIVGAFS